MTAILQSGKNLVTPLGWFYPPSEERQRFDAIATDAGVTLHGTGIHPGGITERFPLMISALSGSITHVRAEEFSDIRTYGAADVVRDWMLFGKTPEEARASIMVEALGTGFRQSLFMVADELGFDLDPELSTTHRMAVATAPIDSPIGPIQPGTVAAQRFTWEATVDGEPVVTAAVNWFMGEVDLDPAWTFGPEGERFEVEVTGTPAASPPSRSCTPSRSRPAWCATRESWPPLSTASTPSPTSAPRPPGCSATWTCRWWQAGPPSGSIGTGAEPPDLARSEPPRSTRRAWPTSKSATREPPAPDPGRDQPSGMPQVTSALVRLRWLLWFPALASAAYLLVQALQLATHNHNDLDVYLVGAKHLFDGTMYTNRSSLFGLPFLYPPIAGLAFLPLTWIKLKTAVYLWAVFNSVLLMGLIGVSIRAARPAMSWSRLLWWSLALSWPAYHLDPIFQTMNFGSDQHPAGLPDHERPGHLPPVPDAPSPRACCSDWRRRSSSPRSSSSPTWRWPGAPAPR